MDKLKNYAWRALEKSVMFVGSERSKFRQQYFKAKDEAFGRERVGRDKHGNSYYQYYSLHGLPTRRIVLYKFFDTNKFHIDTHFLGWLRRNEMLPPSPEQLEQLYLEHDAFMERALQWDKEQELIIREWDQKKKLLDEQQPERDSLTG